MALLVTIIGAQFKLDLCEVLFLEPEYGDESESECGYGKRVRDAE
jgi:hypothetical protein